MRGPGVWPAHFVRRLGPGWPHTVGYYDVETTGLRLDPDPDLGKPADLVTEFGWCLTVGHEPADMGHFLVDWTRHPGVDPGWLRDRLVSRDEATVIKGGRPGCGYDELSDRGHPPAAVAGFVRDWTRRLRACGVPAAAHNGYRFDEPVLQRFLAAVGADPAWGFGPDGLVDTLGVEMVDEAVRLALDDFPPEVPDWVRPGPAESARDYFGRVVRSRPKGVRASLSGHCHAKYKMASAGLDRSQMHGSQADAFALHLMVKAWHSDRPAEPTPSLPTPPTAPPPGCGGRPWAGDYRGWHGPPRRV